MSYTVKESNKKEVVFEITVSKEEFEKGLQKSFVKNCKRFAIPGFRKGKAPRKMVEQYYGEGVLFEDAVNELIPVHYDETVKDADFDIISQPEIELVSISKEEGFVFTAKAYLKPEVEIKNYKGIKAEKNVYTVSEDDVNREINTMKERCARQVEVTDRAVKEGDIANINFEGFCDGVAFEGGKGENFDLTIGSGQFIPGFEEQLIGKGTGDDVEVNVTFPEEYHAEELKGKAAMFKVKINSVMEKQYPELDDEFAKDVSAFDTFKELKEDVEKKLSEQAANRTKEEFENNVLEEVANIVEVEVPDCMIEERIDGLANDFAYRLQAQGMSKEMYFQYTGLTEEAFRGQFKERAEKQVKISLALAKIAELEKIEVSDEDVEAEFNKMAEAYNMEIDKVKQFVRAEDLKEQLVMNKTVEFVTENAVEGKPAAKKTAAKKTTAKKAADDKEEKPAKKTTAKKTTTTKKTAAKADDGEAKAKKAPAKKTTKKKAESEE